MVTSEARVQTGKADRYANRLCKHFAHEIRAEWTPPEGLAEEFPKLGTCRMTANPDELVLTVEAPDAEKLDRVQGIVGSHLEQFGKRDGLTVSWGAMTGNANDSEHVRVPTTWKAPDPTEHRRGSHRRDRYWALGSAKRSFYICATAGPCDWRTALCVFDTEEAAKEHLRSLGDAQLFLDTLERYGASMPDWMRRDPLLPEVEEVLTRELWRILESIGVEYVTVNPPTAGERTETLELLPASNFAA